MYEQTSPLVAVAVPHDGVPSALRYAAHEAISGSCPLLLVHPTRNEPPQQARGVLRRAAATVELLAGPGVPVNTRMAAGGDVESVIAACPDAEQVVVHHRELLHLLFSLSHGEGGSQAGSAVTC